MTTPYVLEFTIPDAPKSPNVFYSSHWRVRHTHSKRWHSMVFAKVWPHKPAAPLKKARLILTRYSVRKMDDDNCRLSFKPVVDALVKYGVLSDDSVDVIGSPDVRQEKAEGRQKRVRVRIEEVIEQPTVGEN